VYKPLEAFKLRYSRNVATLTVTFSEPSVNAKNLPFTEAIIDVETKRRDAVHPQGFLLSLSLLTAGLESYDTNNPYNVRLLVDRTEELSKIMVRRTQPLGNGKHISRIFLI
jgi:hypothetical protein